MQSFDTAEAIAKAHRTVTDPQLKNLLTDRIQDWTDRGLLGLTHLGRVNRAGFAGDCLV